MHDDDGSIVAYAMTGGALHFWRATDDHATNWTETGTSVKACCNDPIVWKDGGTWYAITAHHGGGDVVAATATSAGPNYGDETFFASPVLCGSESDWKQLPLFFADRGSLLVPGHNMTHEFVSRESPLLCYYSIVVRVQCLFTTTALVVFLLSRIIIADFFQNLTGDPSNTASVFLTSTYGAFADPWLSKSGLYNYALFFVGSQPAGAGTPFVPRLTSAVDWSPFSPHAATPGGLDVATGWGPTQYGCCPKTVADPPLLPVRFQIIDNARIENVGKSQSCMVSDAPSLVCQCV